MKKFYIFLIALFMGSGAMAQTKQPCSTCLPEGIVINTQAQIDSFQFNYPGCTEILGDMRIGIDCDSTITDLKGLNVLTSIGGSLMIECNLALPSLEGLDNLKSIGGVLQIEGNWSLTNLAGLDNLDSIGGLNIYSNLSLTSLTGLENIDSIGYLNIYSNLSLTSLTGLENLEFIRGDFVIEWNDSLSSISSLENLTYIGGGLYIQDNFSLATCNDDWLCNYLSDTSAGVSIGYNAPGCNSLIEVGVACGGLPCLPHANYGFLSQTDIDHFSIAFPGCKELESAVTISGWDNITNLNGLNQITSIGGLCINDNSALTTLTGLEKLVTIGGDVLIGGNSALTSLDGLDNLTSIGGFLYVGSINYMGIYTLGNPAMKSLTGLGSLTSIGGHVWISDNDALTSLSGLESIHSLQSLWVSDNDSLPNLHGVDNLTSIEGSLCIWQNNVMTSLTGIDNLDSIRGNLYISPWSPFGSGNPSLVSLTGLEGLNYIGGSISITKNHSLASLSVLERVDAGSINHLAIFYNDALSSCDVRSICDYLGSPESTFEIHDNAEGCNSKEEVITACAKGMDESAVGGRRSAVGIFPNPASTTITISTPTAPEKNTILTIYNLHGQKLIALQITEHQTVVDVSGLSQGVYFVRVDNDRSVRVTKFIHL